MAHGEALIRQAVDRAQQSAQDTVRAALAEGLADVHARLDALEAEVQRLRGRLEPPASRAGRAAKAKPTGEDLPVELSD